MHDFHTPGVVPLNNLPRPGPDTVIADLVGRVYDTVPARERGLLLQHLLRPLGVLSLVGIANGVFARLRLHGGLGESGFNTEEGVGVHTEDVVVLVNHVQEICVEAVDGLAHFLMTSPALAGSAVAVLLATLLIEREQARSIGAAEPGPSTWLS